MRRKMKIHYSIHGEREWATIETENGYYVCEVYRCLEEGQRRFRQRARSLMEALERYPYPLVLLGGNA